MKKVFLFLMSALVCGIMMTSCSDDESDAPVLTGITVAPSTITLPVGGEQKITPTANPKDASALYEWKSSDTIVATVDAQGIVKIVGVGTATITVTSGTVSATVAVEGTINGLEVKDDDGNIAGTYPYNGTSVTFKLTATIDPANSGKKPEWSSSASTATVTPSDDGLSADVIVSGEGTAVITAAVGNITATYTISTTSVFESAVGYWTFDDPTNPGKATKGEDLWYDPTWIQVVDGPSATNKAVYVKQNVDESLRHNYGDCHDVNDTTGLYWNHSLTGNLEISGANANSVSQFTILIDARVPNEPNNYHYPIFRTIHESVFHYGSELRPDNSNLVICRNWGSKGNVLENVVTGEEPWVRVVIKYDNSALTTSWDDNHGRGDQWTYSNGVRVFETLAESSGKFVAIYEGFPIKFLGGMPTGENFNYSVSTIAVWDKLLTDEEIASLGGVSK
ncbi:MAG: Ig-like domain-containing protein [Prevotellaceae bacterium]|jgi:hypothetical protein|nr:Ig-like domain-containing protein [Prevotellaceae bacterium]